MGTSDGRDPLGTYQKKVVLTTKAATIATAVTAYVVDSSHDRQGRVDLIHQQVDLLRQASRLEST